ncbi:hypothetical protein V462_14070 [Pantoea ananatis 15320]|nr:hypothetical protein V462_14070 [Pantoea ananatis 15320]
MKIKPQIINAEALFAIKSIYHVGLLIDIFSHVFIERNFPPLNMFLKITYHMQVTSAYGTEQTFGLNFHQA